MLSRGTFCAALGSLFATGANQHSRDEGWHHVHGPNGLSLATTVPLDLAFVTIDGATFRLVEHRGNVVVINLFASWCAPCNAEMPDVSAFAAQHVDDTTVVSVDVGEPLAAARHFQQRFALVYPVASDESSRVSKAIGLQEYPTTLFVRPSGLLACAFVGQMSREALEAERTNALAERG